MTALLQGERAQDRPEMIEGPRLFDDLGLVALPTAVSCARMFVQHNPQQVERIGLRSGGCGGRGGRAGGALSRGDRRYR